MGTDTPNILSRETTFWMGILKKCLAVEKVPIEQNTPNNVQNPIPVSDPAPDCTDQLQSTEGVFRHSVPSMEAVFAIQLCQQKGNYLAIQFRPRKLDLR